MSSKLVEVGYLSQEELNLPTLEEMQQGPLAVIECMQDIPCNPCEQACPFGAIHVGNPITSLPALAREKCKGCGVCVAKCPGLAIFVVDAAKEGQTGTVTMPYEYLPLPSVGDMVAGLNRKGEYIEKVRVEKVSRQAGNDCTAVVTVAVSKQHIHEIRCIKVGEGE